MHYAVPQNKSTQEGLVIKCVEYSLKENKHFAIHKSTSPHSYILKSGATDENSNNSNNNSQENWQVRISIKYARTKSSDANYWQSYAVQYWSYLECFLSGGFLKKNSYIQRIFICKMKLCYCKKSFILYHLKMSPFYVCLSFLSLSFLILFISDVCHFYHCHF